MRVLYLNHNVAWSGGTFFRALAVGREVARRGHEVTLLTIAPARRWGSETRMSDGVEVVETPDWLWGIGRTGWDPFDTAWRCAWLRGRTWDVIHAWDSRPAVILPALFARRQSPSARLFIDWADWWGRGGTQAEREGGLVKRLYGPIETYFEEAFRTRADGSTAISNALLDRAVRLGVPAGSITLLPQGCDVRDADLDRGGARARLGIPAAQPLFVTVGRILPADARLLFATITEVTRRLPGARFVLVGRHGAAIPPALLSDGTVSESGFVSEAVLDDYVAACDALVVPLADNIASRARWPSKANGFLAAGRAVAMTRVGDLPALLDAERAAFVAEPAPGPLAEAVLATLDATEAQRREARARALARARLAWPVIVDELLARYQQQPDPRRALPARGIRTPAT